MYGGKTINQMLTKIPGNKAENLDAEKKSRKIKGDNKDLTF